MVAIGEMDVALRTVVDTIPDFQNIFSKLLVLSEHRVCNHLPVSHKQEEGDSCFEGSS